MNTYCSWGMIPGSAEWGVIGVIGEGVEGPIVGVTPVLTDPPKFTIGLTMECCWKLIIYIFYQVICNFYKCNQLKLQVHNMVYKNAGHHGVNTIL